MTARGIGVSVHGKTRELLCRAPAMSNLIELEKMVPCDTENALAACK